MSKYFKFLIFIIILGFIFAGGAKLLKKRRAEIAISSTPKVVPANVTKEVIKEDERVITLPAIGVVKSSINSVVSTKVTGRVIKVFKKTGDIVNAGEILCEIDNSDYKRQIQSLKLEISTTKALLSAKKEELSSSEIKLSNLKATHSRTKKLLDMKGASIEDYQNEENQIAATVAQIAAIKSQIISYENKLSILDNNIAELQNLLTYTIIKTPIKGVVAESLISEGEMALMGKSLFKINSTKDLYVEVGIPTSVNFNQAIFKGSFYDLLPLSTTKNGIRVYKLSGVFEDLVDGEYVNLDIVVFNGKGIFLPHNAILSKDKTNSIFVYDEKIPEVKEYVVDILASGSEGVAVSIKNKELIIGKSVIIAMPDILLRIASGVPVHFMDN